MNNRVFISICIPAYKRPERIKRLLVSIAAQTFTDFEVIVTDDSPDSSVKDIVDNNELSIQYFKNEPALGTPANWNYSISRATGEWIKLMHDDDWFSSPDSLAVFAKSTTRGKKFIFSAYTNVYGNDKSENIFFPLRYQKKIIENPMLLLPKNIIGPPSVTMVHRSIIHQYDTRMKWRVDIDFYMRVIENEKKIFYINRPLINVGISESQVTNTCLNNPEVELPEGLLLLSKFGIDPLNNIWVYDTWWRLLRNMNIKERALSQYTPGENWPAVILNLIRHQSKLKNNWLKFGAISKFFMFISYLLNRSYLKTE